MSGVRIDIQIEINVSAMVAQEDVEDDSTVGTPPRPSFDGAHAEIGRKIEPKDEPKDDFRADASMALLEVLASTPNQLLDAEEEKVASAARQSRLLAFKKEMEESDEEEICSKDSGVVSLVVSPPRAKRIKLSPVSSPVSAAIVGTPGGKVRPAQPRDIFGVETPICEPVEECDGSSSSMPSLFVRRLQNQDIFPSDEEEEDDEDAPLVPVIKVERTAYPFRPATYAECEEMFRIAFHHQPVKKRLYATARFMTGNRELSATTYFNKCLEYIKRMSDVAPREHIEVHDDSLTAYLPRPMLPHQRHGLAWMLWREAQVVAPGGILADEMGLGKTYAIIALIVAQRANEKQRQANEGEEEVGAWLKYSKVREIHDKIIDELDGVLPSRGTVIVCPATLVHQWAAEIAKFVTDGTISVYIYHGKGRQGMTIDELRKYGVVITSYDTMRTECDELPMDVQSVDEEDDLMDDSPFGNKAVDKRKARPTNRSILLSIAWRRVVLDESHYIKNCPRGRSRGACHLLAQSRWCLTGTPVHNCLRDFYSYVRFLRLQPFDELLVWKYRIESTVGRKENTKTVDMKAERLKLLVSAVLLRRQKTQKSKTSGMEMVALPRKHINVASLSFSTAERIAYEAFSEFGRNQVEKLLMQRAAGHARQGDMLIMIVLLMRLRQFAVHASLIKHAIDVDELVGMAEVGDVKTQDVDDVDAAIEQQMLKLGMVDEDRKGKKKETITKEDVGVVFEPTAESAKINALIGYLARVLEDGDDKILVLSQWTSVLDLVELHISNRLGGRYFGVTRIDGKVPIEERHECVREFNRKGGPRVMLLSITAGGCGLNLIGGNHVVLMDLHWNPQVENQAYDRAHRLGQTKDVQVTKFYIEESIESRVMELQKAKEELAKAVLDGTRARVINRLTIADIKFLFNIK